MTWVMGAEAPVIEAQRGHAPQRSAGGHPKRHLTHRFFWSGYAALHGVPAFCGIWYNQRIQHENAPDTAHEKESS
jgi:hypothetical protein